MHFQRLRLSGFKSFVEGQEFRIEPGLTGVVGPNGCGKSNLLEALRWVSGANSAKAMRADGMDDVIFAGSGSRPSRNHAEVGLTIDNADRTAPAAWANEPVLEVVRRIDRGYRIHLPHQRPRGQGARCAAVVCRRLHRGQLAERWCGRGRSSELIAAKPQNRRMILEEAGGVSGLHGRRHEAELRLRAAETNMARLDDVAGELEQTLGRLKREARQAEKYKRLSAEIRSLQSALLYARWADARDTLEAGRGRGRQGRPRRGGHGPRRRRPDRRGRRGRRRRSGPCARRRKSPGAVLQRLAIDRDRLEREAAQAAAQVERLVAERLRVAADRERELHIVDDAAAALERLNAELALVGQQAGDAPRRLPALIEGFARRRCGSRPPRKPRSSGWPASWPLRTAERHRRRSRGWPRPRAKTAAMRGRWTPPRPIARRWATRSTPVWQRRRPGSTRRCKGCARPARPLTQAETDLAAAGARRGRGAQGHAHQTEDQLGRLKTEARGLAQLTAPSAKTAFAPALDQVSPGPATRPPWRRPWAMT